MSSSVQYIMESQCKEPFWFLHEFTATWRLKIAQNDFFGKTFDVFGTKGVQIASREVSKFCEKSIHGTLQIFCMKLQQHEGVKWTQMGFFVEKSCTGVFGQKVTQNEFFWVL